MPDADSLKTWARHGEPVLSHAPVKIEAAALAGAMERLAAVLAARGGFAASTSEALSRTSWERMVAASDLALAGCNPAAYVESFVELLEDDGMDEDAARIGAMAAALALRAFLEVWRRPSSGRVGRRVPTSRIACAAPCAAAKLRWRR